MIDIDFLKYKDKVILSSEGDQTFIFDPIRKKRLVLQPEELVRQIIILFLINDAGYPKNAFNVEKQIRVHQVQRRFDIIIYHHNIRPWMLIEVKSFKVPITQQTADQLFSYNKALNAPYLLVSNGLDSFCFKEEDDKLVQLSDLPHYE